MKKFMMARGNEISVVEPARGRVSKAEIQRREDEKSKRERLLQEMAMEVAADDDQPFPAPYPKKKGFWATSNNKKKKKIKS